MLGIGLVQLRLDFGIYGVLFGVRDHADNQCRGVFRARATEFLADRVFSRPVAARHRSIDDANTARIALTVGLDELAPRHERYFHGAKIAGADAGQRESDTFARTFG